MLTSANIITETQNNYTVETEIYLLYVGILVSRDMGTSSFILNKDSETTVNGTAVTGSPMSVEGNYYKTWQGKIINSRYTIEMQKVIDRYTQLGYTINRKSDDMEHLYWQITW